MPGFGYSEAKYDARVLVKWGDNVDVGTSTVSGANELATVYAGLPKVLRRTNVNNIRVKVRTAAHTDVSAGKLIFLNGTATVASVDGTGTAGVYNDATMTAANQALAADDELSVKWEGTATASGQQVGDFDIWAEIQELNATD